MFVIIESYGLHIHDNSRFMSIGNDLFWLINPAVNLHDDQLARHCIQAGYETVNYSGVLLRDLLNVLNYRYLKVDIS